MAALVMSGAAMTAARAADASSGSESLWDKVLGTLDLRTKVGDMPDFVKATHPDVAKLKYIPTGAPHVNHPVPVKSATDVEATKQALDAARNAQLNPPAPAAPAAVPAKPKPVKPKPVKPTPASAQN